MPCKEPQRTPHMLLSVMQTKVSCITPQASRQLPIQNVLQHMQHVPACPRTEATARCSSASTTLLMPCVSNTQPGRMKRAPSSAMVARARILQAAQTTDSSSSSRRTGCSSIKRALSSTCTSAPQSWRAHGCCRQPQYSHTARRVDIHRLVKALTLVICMQLKRTATHANRPAGRLISIGAAAHACKQACTEVMYGTQHANGTSNA